MSDSTKPLRLVVNRGADKPLTKGVYLVTDQDGNLLARVRSALRGGVSVLQYRAKGEKKDVALDDVIELKRLCRSFGVCFIINDDMNLAREVDADGVHLGQDDGTIASAREMLGREKIIGVSTHTLEEALRAEEEGADYIGFGAIYPTASKKVEHIPGVDGLAAVCAATKIPVVAIGGVNAANAAAIIEAGADAVATISAVLSAPRPEIAAMELNLLFNRNKPYPRGNVLAIAGSDSGGGAGIQADIKTITLLGSYASTVLTALTAQNTREVSAIHGLPPTFILEQLDSILSDIPQDVIKTGMLHTPAIMEALAERFEENKILHPVVVDPVMISKSGAHLMERDAVSTFSDRILPLAYLLTPNLPEAERLLGRPLKNEREIEEGAREIHSMGAANVLIKGGHMTGKESVDTLFDGDDFRHFAAERIFTMNTHGTGCTYASAIAAFLAQGEPLFQAVEKGKQYISAAIRHARSTGKGHSPVNHFAAACLAGQIKH